MNKCRNPLCNRETNGRVAFCCRGCGLAHDGRYEIHESGPLGHSAECNCREAESRPPVIKQFSIKPPKQRVISMMKVLSNVGRLP
jgi:hypothetical protein